MSAPLHLFCRPAERGVALLIAVFALLLISGVAISLIVMAGTESAINANYRGSTQAFYAAYAGVEEVRGRLSPGHPNAFATMNPPFVVTPGAILPVGQVRYVRNPSAGEVVDPTNLAADNPYRDIEYQQEFGVPVTGATVTMTSSVSSVAGLPGPLYKWVRITPKTERSSGVDVNGDAVLNAITPLFFDGKNQNLTSAGGQVFSLTSLAVLPNGSQRMLRYDVAPLAPISVDAAIHTLLRVDVGQALNITGYTDPVCALPPTDGVRSGSTITTPGGGNVSGSPLAVHPYATFPYNVPSLISALQPSSSLINSPGTGVTGSGTPVSYSGPHAVLGVAPTVTYDSSGAITAITNPGTPKIYYSPGNLSLGEQTIRGAPVSGQGILMVNGDLTVDISNGFNYFGLILVTGNITMARTATSASSNIHGAIIAAGKFDGTLLANLQGSIFVHQNACMVQNSLNQPLTILSFREVNQ